MNLSHDQSAGLHLRSKLDPPPRVIPHSDKAISRWAERIILVLATMVIFLIFDTWTDKQMLAQYMAIVELDSWR